MNEELHTLDDKEILKLSLRSPRMFEVLIDRYQEAFLRKSTTILRSKESAEDAVQETFLKIYKYGNRFKEQEGASFKSWAYRILTNTCYTHYVRNKKNLTHIELIDFAEREFADPADPKDEQEEQEKRPYIEAILARMPDNLSHILRLYFLEEKSQKEIAVRENISHEAVRTRIHRAKKYFKDISMKSL